jgi:hypothetical protein
MRHAYMSLPGGRGSEDSKISRSSTEPRPHGSDHGPAAWASFNRLDKPELIPRGACFSLPAGRQPGLSLRATKRDVG